MNRESVWKSNQALCNQQMLNGHHRSTSIKKPVICICLELHNFFIPLLIYHKVRTENIYSENQHSLSHLICSFGFPSAPWNSRPLCIPGMLKSRLNQDWSQLPHHSVGPYKEGSLSSLHFAHLLPLQSVLWSKRSPGNNFVHSWICHQKA